MTWFKNLRELLLPKKNDMCLCMVVSEQEGAEIWVDGQKTPFLTPHIVSFPKNKDSKITVKMIGHFDHEAVLRSPYTLTYHYCKLDRVPLRLVSNEVYQSSAL